MSDKISTITIKNVSKKRFNFANALPVIEPGAIVRMPVTVFTIAPVIKKLIARGELKEIASADADIKETEPDNAPAEEIEEL